MTDALAKFADSLAPPPYDRTEVSERRKNVERALTDCSLDAGYLIESGSWSHGTGIKGKSDVDYMAWASGPQPRLPSSALQATKEALRFCDWKISEIKVSSPVVQLRYISTPHFEIAPAWYKEQTRGFNVFWIAGRADEWVLSAPDAHLDYVNTQNNRLGKKAKPLIRLLKAWKLHAQAPVSSFYLEMRTAEYLAEQSIVIYDLDLRYLLGRLISYELRDMNDPQKIVGRIPSCASDEKRRTALAKAREAYDHLDAAEDAKDAGDKRTYWWHMADVFGTDFPWPDW